MTKATMEARLVWLVSPVTTISWGGAWIIETKAVFGWRRRVACVKAWSAACFCNAFSRRTEQIPSAKRLDSTDSGPEPRFRHEGRKDRQELVNVDSERSHEGRGAGKIVPPGGQIIVSRKRIVTRKEKLLISLVCLKEDGVLFLFRKTSWVSFLPTTFCDTGLSTI